MTDKSDLAGEDGKENAKPGGRTGELANDVARLYSWANIEEADYRDFVRKRRLSSPEDAVPLSLAPPPPAGHGKARPKTPVVPEEPMPGVTREARQGPSAERATHGLAVYSIAGGVGKTTLCANLARLLCSFGEQTLLVDASGRGVLPFYFGAREQRPGLRTFLAPEANCPPLQVIGTEETTPEWLKEEVMPAMRGIGRVIFDMGCLSTGSLVQIFGICAVLLVPLLPDLNSVITVSRIEASLNAMQSEGTETPAAYYLFNQFDEHCSNDRRMQDLVAHQCGERLLPMRIRRGPMAQALSAGLTLTDYEPGSDAARDYLQLALWLRGMAPVALPGVAPGSWIER